MTCYVNELLKKQNYRKNTGNYFSGEGNRKERLLIIIDWGNLSRSESYTCHFNWLLPKAHLTLLYKQNKLTVKYMFINIAADFTLRPSCPL